MRWAVMVAALLFASTAAADVTVGGTAGVTVGDTEYFPTYLAGGSVGVDLHLDVPLDRVELSFDLPSFTTYDDITGPVGELSLVVATALSL